ncbi:MAG: Eco57I restriction-modification methylase domain-containing protein [Actinomycetota bacterium]
MNAEVGPALLGLLVDEGSEGYGPVDFRTLSVREFGTIYEGLLESDLAVAPSDLTLDRNDTYVPAKKGDEVVVQAGEIYLRSRAGTRKASGSYFTKPFAVEHLLDNALEPALDEHIQRLEDLAQADEEAQAAEAFFDFRVADIAMGSGHFLVAAVDRIEARLSSFLAEHPLPGIIKELERLRAAAHEALGEHGIGQEIEHASLLRRQVARRCIYGVDLNPIAVELARLAVWIHTFVRGLPLSFLNHNLLEGNSLTGIGAIEEAVEILDPAAAEAHTGTVSIFREQVVELLGKAEDDLKRQARTSDATAAEIREARKAHAAAEKAIEPAHILFDLLIAMRLSKVARFASFTEKDVLQHKGRAVAEELADELHSLHFPIAFPEVFLRDTPGFDLIIGNPPWEKVKIEEHGWWGLRFPGIRSLPVGQQNAEIAALKPQRPDLLEQYEREEQETDWLREILTKGPYPGMGRGDPDLYKAFAWRFWHLLRNGGLMGVVLPRSALAASGSADWRAAVLDEGLFEDVTLLLNNRQWAFEDVHPQWTLGLVTIRKGRVEDGQVRLRGPFASLSHFLDGHEKKPVEFPVKDFRTWATGAAFPLLPSPDSGEVFQKLRAHPGFGDPSHPWRVRPVREFDATLDKKHMLTSPESTEGMRDAARLLRDYPPPEMPQDEIDRLVDAVEQPYGPRILAIVREAIRSSDDPVEQAVAVMARAQELGLEPSPAVKPLPVIVPDDVHLVCWMAIVPQGEDR